YQPTTSYAIGQAVRTHFIRMASMNNRVVKAERTPHDASRFTRAVMRWCPVGVLAALALAVSLVALPAAAGQRAAGTVKWYDASRGIGFITPAGGGPDVFVRVEAIKTERGLRTLVPGEKVEFSIASGP